MSDTSPEQTNVMLSPRVRGLYRKGGGYINRYKFQRERLRALQNIDDEAIPTENTFHRTNLPKLPQSQPQPIERESSNLSSASSRSIETIKLPSVPSNTKVGQYIKNHPPMRSFHVKLYPDHYSRIARSLPSLPSIPGSPHILQTGASPSPVAEPPQAPVLTKPVLIPSKHRFEVIAFQKTIHQEKADPQTLLPGKDKKKTAYHLDTIPPSPLIAEADDKPVIQKLYREKAVNNLRPSLATKPPASRPRRRFRNSRFSDSKSDGDIHIKKKWKDHCGCLRCQMIKRQWQEGDELYKVWGNYPCHHVDPAAMADDDDD